MADQENQDRRTAEIDLIQSMYPQEISLSQSQSDATYKSAAGSLTLRIPSEYPSSAAPTIISAHAGTSRADVSDQLRRYIADFPAGEEQLDLIISSFEELAARQPEPNARSSQKQAKGAEQDDSAKLTILVWLHHLLATGKRKQVLHPPSPGISGVSKPGYPGVLIFSGPKKAVQEHVGELKQLNWAAFQVRLEEDEEWVFQHGGGVKEVEGMGDVVAEIGSKKDVFLECMKMKG